MSDYGYGTPPRSGMNQLRAAFRKKWERTTLSILWRLPLPFDFLLKRYSVSSIFLHTYFKLLWWTFTIPFFNRLRYYWPDCWRSLTWDITELPPTAARCARSDKPILSDLVIATIKHTQTLLSPHDSERAWVASPQSQLLRGATIIRTQGGRFDLFAEAIASVESQPFPLTPVVVVHGNDKTYARVSQWCRGTSSAAIVLQARDTDRSRGYPCNVGLEYIKRHADTFGFVSFLDDDDIYYPDYAARMATALNISGADVVYAEANRREPWKEHTVGPSLMPATCLVAGNFIVINSFALRTDALIRSGACFEEDMEYLEDWHFLISLLGARVRFMPLFETVTEYRIVSDGNTTRKRFPKLFAACQKRCLDHGLVAARKLGISSFYSSLTTFDFNARSPLGPCEERQLLETLNIFESVWSYEGCERDNTHAG